MKQAKAWAKQKEKSIDDLIAKENQCERELDTALAEFQTLSRKAEAHDSETLWPERLMLRKSMSQETAEQLKSHFGSSFSYRRLQSAQSDVRLYLEENERSLGQYLRRNRQQGQKPKKQEYER